MSHHDVIRTSVRNVGATVVVALFYFMFILLWSAVACFRFTSAEACFCFLGNVYTHPLQKCIATFMSNILRDKSRTTTFLDFPEHLYNPDYVSVSFQTNSSLYLYCPYKSQ